MVVFKKKETFIFCMVTTGLFLFSSNQSLFGLILSWFIFIFLFRFVSFLSFTYFCARFCDLCLKPTKTQTLRCSSDELKLVIQINI